MNRKNHFFTIEAGLKIKFQFPINTILNFLPIEIDSCPDRQNSKFFVRLEKWSIERVKWGEKEWKFFFPLAHKEKCSYEDTQGDNQKGVFWQPDFTLGAPELWKNTFQ